MVKKMSVNTKEGLITVDAVSSKEFMDLVKRLNSMFNRLEIMNIVSLTVWLLTIVLLLMFQVI